MRKSPILPPFKRFCVTIGNLPSSYVDSMSYYECIMWLCKYLKETVIPAVNENAEAVNELINWFNNLDVQDEINNKLDEMVESGELQEIISVYLNSKAIFGYDTVSDMISATNLVDGSYARTLGYNEKNDGGSGLYKIRTVTNEDVVDGGSLIAMNDDSLVAELVVINYINVMQYGFDKTGTTDNTELFNTIIERYEDNIKLYFPAGTYKLNIKLEYDNVREKSILLEGESLKSVKFIPADDTKPLLYLLGEEGYINTDEFVRYVTFRNIDFSTVTNSYCIQLYYAQEIRFENCQFDNSQGGLRLLNCYDSYFINCNMIINAQNNNSFTLDLAGQSNANHFIGCHFERSSRFVLFGQNAYHNVFTNCKFEKGAVDSSSAISAGVFNLYSNKENTFDSCVFVNSDSNTSESVYCIDNGNPFIKASTTNITEFNNCQFETNKSNVYSNWIDGSVKLSNSIFNGCGATKFGLMKLKNSTNINNCEFNISHAVSEDSTNISIFNIEGSYVDIDSIININNQTIGVLHPFYTTASVTINGLIDFKNISNVSNIDVTPYATNAVLNLDIYPKKSITNDSQSITVNPNIMYYNLNYATLKNLYGGHEGQVVYIIAKTNVTIDTTGNIGTNVTSLSSDDVLCLIKCSDKWRTIK